MIITLIKLYFTDKKLLELTIKDIILKGIIEKNKNKQHRLNLCLKHRQELKHSHFSEHNCDYCNAIKGIIRECDKEILIDSRGK